MTLATRVMERLTLVTPLALCFHDSVTDQRIGFGLKVRAYREHWPHCPVHAFPNRWGIYVFNHLPGLRKEEMGAGDDEYWESVEPKRFIVEVEDSERRFLPFLLEAEAPQRGLGKCLGLPIGDERSVPLYSAPTRSVDTGMAILRASLRDPSRGTPAAWALLEVRVGNVWAQGFSDENGNLALIFSYPDLVHAIPDSPLERLPLSRQRWQVDLIAHYSPAKPTPTVPYLRDVLMQPAASLWEDGNLDSPLTSETLTFGKELVLRSRGASLPDPLPDVLITAAL